MCKKHGVPVAKEFKLGINLDKEDLEKIVYPVIVKPADGWASIGLHLCTNEEELIIGYKDAYEKSEAKKVLVEKYYAGSEICLYYTFYNGKATLAESGDAFGYRKENLPFVFAIGPSIYEDRLREELLPNLDKVFKELECNSGVGLVQVIVDGDEYAVTEMNYRLPGGHIPVQEHLCECAVDAAMSQNYFASIPDFAQPHAQEYIIWLGPGTIASIKGFDDIKTLPGVLSTKASLKEGDTVLPNTGMKQIFATVIMGGEFEQSLKTAKIVNEILKIKDQNGQDMMMKFELNEKNQVIKL
jgi:hypothetical protein